MSAYKFLGVTSALVLSVLQVCSVSCVTFDTRVLSQSLESQFTGDSVTGPSEGKVRILDLRTNKRKYRKQLRFVDTNSLNSLYSPELASLRYLEEGSVDSGLTHLPEHVGPDSRLQHFKYMEEGEYKPFEKDPLLPDPSHLELISANVSKIPSSNFKSSTSIYYAHEPESQDQHQIRKASAIPRVQPETRTHAMFPASAPESGVVPPFPHPLQFPSANFPNQHHQMHVVYPFSQKQLNFDIVSFLQFQQHLHPAFNNYLVPPPGIYSPPPRYVNIPTRHMRDPRLEQFFINVRNDLQPFG